MDSSSEWIMSGTARAGRAPRPPSPVYIDLTEPPAWTLEPKIPTLHPRLGLPTMEKAGLKLYWEIIGVENPERMDPHPSLLLSKFELQLIDAPRLGAPPPPPQSPQPEPSEKAKGKARAEPPKPAARLRLVAHRPEDNYEIIPKKNTLAPLANYPPAGQSNSPASQSNLSTSQSNLPTSQNNLPTSENSLPTSQSSSSSSRKNLPTSQSSSSSSRKNLPAGQGSSSTSRKNLPAGQGSSSTSRKNLSTSQGSSSSSRNNLPTSQGSSSTSRNNLSTSQGSSSSSRNNLPTSQGSSSTSRNNLPASQSSSSTSRSNLPTSQAPAKRPGVAQPVTRPQKSRKYHKTQSGPASGPKPESLASKAAHNSIRQRLEREKVPHIARDSPSPEPQDTVQDSPPRANTMNWPAAAGLNMIVAAMPGVPSTYRLARTLGGADLMQ
ncbi:unnamed protein product [Clonostachys rhizophaga]|uniref:Uncharacterized protein n=1 Tax=Clonostachys rhizophaga TaxID=160324 RepID=A0A9N9VJ60_9HYPO|nr:unnamed protein product [Clonostachys rhizophaga]